MGVGETIRQRRVDLGVTSEDAAAWAGLSELEFTAIEGGKHQPSWGELTRVARALAVEAEALLGSGDTDPFGVRCRTPDGVPSAVLKGHDARMLARAARLARVALALAEETGRGVPILQHRAVRPVAAPPPEEWAQGYELGVLAREKLSPEQKPLQSVQELLERLGVHVGFVDFETRDVDAASIIAPGVLPTILVNRRSPRSQSPLSRRAVLAHELGHLLFDAGAKNQSFIHASFAEIDVAIERRARGFAPAFLAPPKWISRRPDLPPLEVIHLLATDWGMTGEGAAWHAKNSRILSADVVEQQVRYAAKWKLVSTFETFVPQRLAADAVEADEIDPIVDGLMIDVILDAAGQEIIGAGRARELLRGDA